MRNVIVLIGFSIFLAGCLHKEGTYAPVYQGGYLSSNRDLATTPEKNNHVVSHENVVEHNHHVEQPTQNIVRHYDGPKHHVQRGETLFAIAKQYDVDYRDLAALNDLKPPYQIKSGNVIFLPEGTRLVKEPETIVSTPVEDSVANVVATRNSANITWQWPIRGQVVEEFNSLSGNNGIIIESSADNQVLAAADGLVTYVGEHLAEYGKLIIIDHGNHHLSVYGYNDEILVNQQTRVERGQLIASIQSGMTVHFEIRKDGVPVDPMHYLPK